MTRRNLWFVLLVLLQVLVLIGLAGSSYATVQLGQEIKLKTIPVDPRDVLYGDYVTLQYEISRLEPRLWHGEEPYPPKGTAVYTVLKLQGRYYEPVAAYPSKPAVQAGEVVIKGIVDSSWSDRIAVRYGIERYYVPEGTGLDLERKADRLEVTVRISPWGQNVITGVQERP